MRISIDAECNGPISILRELPDARLALLEGLNGIGKTLAVRLLQICTGTVPYRTDSPAWVSLRDALGAFKVEVSGVGDRHTIVWVGDSRAWLTGPGLGPEAARFHSVELDGQPIEAAEIRRLLSVDRIAGDEDILDTLAAQAAGESEVIRAWARRYASPEEGALANLEAPVAAVLDHAPELTKSAWVERERQLVEMFQRLDRTVKRLDLLEERRTITQRALDTAHQLEQFRSREPELEAELRKLDRSIDDTSLKRDQAEKQIRELSGRVAVAGPARRDLQNAQRTMQRNRANLEGAINRSASLAARIGIEPNNEAAVAALEDIAERIELLSSRRAELDVAPTMTSLLTRLHESLTTAAATGVGEEVAWRSVDEDLLLSVDQVAEGVLRSKSEYEGKPAPTEVRDLDDEIQALQAQKPLIDALASALTDVERFTRLVDQNEERVRQALIATDPSAKSQLDQLDATRRQFDDTLMRLVTRRAALQDQLGLSGGPSNEQVLSQQLSEDLTVLEIDVSQLAESLARTITEEADVRSLHSNLDSQSKALRKTLAAEVRNAQTFLALAGQHTWLSVPEIIINDSAPATVLEMTDTVRAQLETLLDRLGAMRVQAGALVSGLQAVSDNLKGSDTPVGEYSTELHAWLGKEFSAWFNLQRVREQLLPTATGDVEVDVERRVVLWPEGDSQRSRPLEAFSSGEQAFAYTRARMGILDDVAQRPMQRLIVLDEFGAFISHDRLNQLIEYLRERSGEHPRDQVLVVLPLGQNYTELAEAAIGPEEERYARLAAQVAERKFAVQELA